MIGISALIKETGETGELALSLLFPVRIQGEDGHLEAFTRLSPDTRPAGTLILDFPAFPV